MSILWGSMRTDQLFEKYYYSRPEFTDGTTEFHRLVAAQVTSGGRILEIGAGPANRTSAFLATLGAVVGVDVTPEIESNTALTEKHVFDGVHIPIEDESFDVCVSNWVLEHVRDPLDHFREVARILRPGGSYCFRTPNCWHYFTVGAQLLPFTMHVGTANKLRGLPKDAHDPYPTWYRANSVSNIRRFCRLSGLVSVTLSTIEKEPSYGRLHALLFYPMLIYERVVNSSSALASFRASILAVLRKPC